MYFLQADQIELYRSERSHQQNVTLLSKLYRQTNWLLDFACALSAAPEWYQEKFQQLERAGEVFEKHFSIAHHEALPDVQTPEIRGGVLLRERM